jgi:hypothetical protein
MLRISNIKIISEKVVQVDLVLDALSQLGNEPFIVLVFYSSKTVVGPIIPTVVFDFIDEVTLCLIG